MSLQAQLLRGSLRGEGPRGTLRVTVPRGTTVSVSAAHPRSWKSPMCPAGGRSLGPLLVTIPRDTSAFPAAGARTVPLQGKRGAASACSSLLPPTRRVCRTLPTGPKPTAEHPKAEFEKCSSAVFVKCSSVLSRPAARPLWPQHRKRCSGASHAPWHPLAAQIPFLMLGSTALRQHLLLPGANSSLAEGQSPLHV